MAEPSNLKQQHRFTYLNFLRSRAKGNKKWGELQQQADSYRTSLTPKPSSNRFIGLNSRYVAPIQFDIPSVNFAGDLVGTQGTPVNQGETQQPVTTQNTQQPKKETGSAQQSKKEAQSQEIKKKDSNPTAEKKVESQNSNDTTSQAGFGDLNQFIKTYNYANVVASVQGSDADVNLDSVSFANAFSGARAIGAASFNYRGKVYTTMYQGETEQEWINTLQKNFYMYQRNIHTPERIQLSSKRIEPTTTIADKKQQGGTMQQSEQQEFVMAFAEDLQIQDENQLQQALQQLGEQGIQALYQVWKQNGKQKGVIRQALQQMAQARKARQGARLAYLQQLNGKCPEGYEVEKFMAGGCAKCRKKQQESLMKGTPKARFEACGGKAKKKKK